MLTLFGYICVLLFQSWLGGQSTAVNEGYLVRNFTVEDGLPVNSVWDIKQDEKGYLYFATLSGLVRYDGYSFESFNSSNTNGIISERFISMSAHPNNDLWLVTEAGFLTRYRNGIFKTYPPINGFGKRSNLLTITNDGTIWNFSEEEITYYEEASDRFIPVKINQKLGRIRGFDALSKDEFYVSDSEYIYRWSKGNLEELLGWVEIPFEPNTANGLRYVGNNILWLLHKNGVLQWNTKTRELRTLHQSNSPDLNILQVYREESRTIFSSISGFSEFDEASEKIRELVSESQEADPNTIKRYIRFRNNDFFLGGNVFKNKTLIFQTENYRTGFIDRDGSIWIASDKHGLFQLKESVISNITENEAAGLVNVYPIIEASDNTIWTGSFEHGLTQFKNNQVLKSFNSTNSALPSNIIRSIYEDTDETLYVGLWSEGLWRLKNGKLIPEEGLNRLQFSDITVEAMHRDFKNRLIVGTRDSSYVKNGNDYIPIEKVFGLSVNAVRVIKQNKQNVLFFGTNGNGITIISPNFESTTITEADGISSNLIRDIFIQSADTIWIATENKGLNRLTFSEKMDLNAVTIIGTDEGLKANSLHRIIDDGQGVLWISSNNGIMAISKKNLNAYADGTSDFLQVTVFDESNGMVNREANGGVQSAGIQTSDQNIWFPNQSGITIVDVEGYHSGFQTGVNSTPVIEYIATQDSVLNTIDSNTAFVKKTDRNLKIKFTAPNYLTPERVVFRYHLSEVDNGWQIANQLREVTYNNMKPGNYDFDVEAIWGSGEISEASITITIPPYFYETSYFRFLVLAGFIGISFMVYQYRVYNLKKRERELEGRVKQQTHELKQAADEKSRFFSGITHELKTPLSLILGPLDDFLEKKNTDSGKKLLKHATMMHRNGYRLKNLVDQILDVSKLNTHAIRLKLQPCDIVLFTKQICGQFKSLLDQKRISLHVREAVISEPIYIDKDAWERIIINLLSNAIKFSTHGDDIEISIVDGFSQISISVRDYGQGIPLDEQARVFEYLYQVHGKQASEGTGIGLYLVKGLTERMGGSVSLVSQENKGAIFTITLKKGYAHFKEEDYIAHEPLKVEKTQSVEPVQTNPVKINKNKREGLVDTEKILIVEDNIDFRNYLKDMLGEKYEVYTAENGSQGLEMVQEIYPDIVISDVMMPVMNGFEFVSKLRKLDGLNRLPVIFLSAKDQDVDMEEGLSTGADVYLSKPIRFSTLISQVIAILRRERILKKEGGLEQAKKEEPELITQLRKIIFRQLANPALSVPMLADALFMSRAKLYREWNQVSEISITEFIKQIRFEEAKHLIKEQGFSIHDVAKATGFRDQSYFSTSFKKQFGFPPSELMK